MSYAFTKLFSSITDSTVWGESSDVRIVWITLLAMADRDGMVHASIPGLAHEARVSVSVTREALRLFMEPDPDSRTKDHEGRRIAEIDGGWILLNHAKYRALRDADERRAYKAKKERERREKIRKNANSNEIKDSRGQKRGQRGQKWTGVDIIAEADAEADASVAGTNTLNSPNSTGNTQSASSPRGVAEQPVVVPPPSGVRVMPPPSWRLTEEQRNAVDLVLVASPPGIVAGLSAGAVTPAQRVLVITAAKREAHEHHVSHGEALDGIFDAVKHQAASIPFERLNLCGGFEKYFNTGAYRKDPIHFQERGYGKSKAERTQDAVRSVVAAKVRGNSELDTIDTGYRRLGAASSR